MNAVRVRIRRRSLWLSLLVGCGSSGGESDAATEGSESAEASATEDEASSAADDADADAGDDAAEADTTTDDTTSTSTDAGTEDTTGTGEDPDLGPEDFACLLDWPKVRRFRITNVLGDEQASIDVANSPTGGVYPVGTLIQLIPTEAMVKRAPGWNPASNDWEFFSLEVDGSGTQILDRGAESVLNQFGGNCFDCHVKAEPQWDFVCEQDHGCDPLPLTEALIDSLQEGDPRCE